MPNKLPLFLPLACRDYYPAHHHHADRETPAKVEPETWEVI